MAVDDPVDEVEEIEAVLDALSAPDAQDVYRATRLYNGHTLAAVAAKKAITDLVGGGTGDVPSTRTLTAGSGLSGGGDLAANRTFDVNVDGSTLEINADTLRVKDGGVTAAKLSFDPATQAELDAHISDATAAHAATAIGFTPAGTISSTTVQAAIEEVAAEATGGGSGSGFQYNLDDDASVIGDGVADDSAAVQAFIDGVPDGSLITGSGRYLCDTGLDLSARKGLRFLALGGPPYIADTFGPSFITGTGGMTLFTINNSGSLVHTGPVFEGFGFFDVAGGGTLFNINNTNRWGFRNCVLAGAQSGTRSVAGVLLSGSADDLGYWFFDETSVISFGPVGSYTADHGGLVLKASTQQAGTIKGGAWQGNWPSIDGQHGVGLRAEGVKFDGGVPAVRDATAASEFVNCEFEIATNPGSGYQAVSGCTNPILIGCKFKKGGSSTGSTGWTIDSGVFDAQIIAPYYENLATEFVDNGTDTLIIRATGTGTKPYLKARGIVHCAGTGSPESAVTAPKGSIFHRTDGGAGTGLYVKETGAGNTGWVAMVTAGAASTISVVTRSTDSTAINSGTTGNTLTSDDTLLIPISASATEIWFFDAYLAVNAANATMDVKFGWSVPASCLMSWGNGDVAGATVNPGFYSVSTATSPQAALGGAGVVTVGTLNGLQMVHLSGWIYGGGTAGNVNLQMAQNTSDAGNLFLKKGSHLKYYKVIA